jgi:hypothetical protein
MIPSLAQAKADLQEAERVFRKKVAAAQKRCSHQALVECDYEETPVLGGCLRPWRCCQRCGISEEGWGCGYLLLKEPEECQIQSVSRQRLFAMCEGLRIHEDTKGPLLRRETTVRELIDQWRDAKR